MATGSFRMIGLESWYASWNQRGQRVAQHGRKLGYFGGGGLEALGGNGLEARWTHWLEASVTGG